MSEETEFFDELLSELNSHFKTSGRVSYTGCPNREGSYRIRVEHSGDLETDDVDEFLNSNGTEVEENLIDTNDTYRVRVSLR